MPGDPYHKVTSGQVFEPFAHQVHNDVLDTTLAFKKGRFGQGAQGPALERPSSVLLRCVNASGGALERGSIVGILEPLRPTESSAPPEGDDRLAVLAVAPREEDRDIFAVIDTDLHESEDAAGRAVIAGLCWCRVQIEDESHRFARAKVAQTGALISSERGGARLVWRGGESGEVWCLVLLGAGQVEELPDEIEGTLEDDVDETSDGSFMITITHVSNGDTELIDESVEVINPPSGLREGEFVFSGTSGATVRATRFGDTLRCTWIECNVEA